MKYKAITLFLHILLAIICIFNIGYSLSVAEEIDGQLYLNDEWIDIILYGQISHEQLEAFKKAEDVLIEYASYIRPGEGLLEEKYPPYVLENLNFLKCFENIKKLTIEGRFVIEDYTYIGKLTGLEELTLRNIEVNNLDFVSTLTNLEVLCLSEANITDISPLKSLTRLWNLILSNNKITDISVLCELPSLEWVRLNGNIGIKSLEPLKSCLNLELLAFSHTGVYQLDDVAYMTNLQELSAVGNGIKSLEPLRGLTNLSFLNVEDNEITDVEPILALRKENLTTVQIVGNPIFQVRRNQDTGELEVESYLPEGV